MSSRLESSDNPWPAYYEKMRGRPPRETLLRALGALEAQGLTTGNAVDLGAGNGRDTLELLRRDWSVTAIDSQDSGLVEIETAASALPGQLTTLCHPMETVQLPAADLINASFSLFLVPLPELTDLMTRISIALKPDGCFAGHFLGPKDTWAGREGVTILNEEETRALLSPLSIEWWWEEEDDGVTARGEKKHWHLFHTLAKKTS